MLGSSTWLLLIGAAQVLDEPIYLYTGETFCHHVNYFFVASTTYGFFFGGFGIAMMRMMFVQFPSRIPIGQVSTALTIGTATFVISVVSSYFWVISPKRSQDLTSVCLARSSEFHLTLFYYSSDHSLTYEGRLVSFVALLMSLMIVVSEFAMYASLYKFLVKHDRMMSLVLSQNAIQTRLRKNVIDLAGHAITFSIQMLWVMIGAMGSYWIPGNVKWVARLMVMSIYGFLSMLNIVFSVPLRAECATMYSSLRCNFLILAQSTWHCLLATSNGLKTKIFVGPVAIGFRNEVGSNSSS